MNMVDLFAVIFSRWYTTKLRRQPAMLESRRVSEVDPVDNVIRHFFIELALISFFAFVPYSACAQIRSGTVIVLGISHDKVIVAGDSRGLIAGQAPYDHYCKITALGTRLIFTESGLAADIHTVDVSQDWDAATEASRAFEMFQKSKTKTDVVDQVSTVWAVSMKKRYSRLLQTHTREILARDGDGLITSFFVGLDVDGHIRAREIVISFDRAGEESGTPKVLVDNKLWEITNENTFTLTGHGEIGYEFATEASTRAKIEAQRWALEMTKHIGEDPDLLNAMHLVDVSKTYAPTEWGIGGPTDVVEIFPNTGVRWIYRKPECPADGAK
jgi:hypothetical protein